MSLAEPRGPGPPRATQGALPVGMRGRDGHKGLPCPAHTPAWPLASEFCRHVTSTEQAVGLISARGWGEAFFLKSERVRVSV